MHEVVFDRTKSYKDYHSLGVYSFFIREGCRVFYVANYHDLWLNFPYTKNMSVAYHDHKRKLQFYCLFGNVYHYKANIRGEYVGWELTPFKFESKILGGSGKFTKYIPPEGIFGLQVNNCTQLSSGQLDCLETHQYHTIAVEHNREACWIVKEENEGKCVELDNICWSNSDLTKFNPENYYKPIPDEEWNEIVNKIKHRVDKQYWWVIK